MARCTDLSLALSRQLQIRREWHILIIGVLLVSTLVFCYSLVQLCLELTSKVRQKEQLRLQQQQRRDARAVRRAAETVAKDPPPMYGLWGCSYVASVRLNARPLTGIACASIPRDSTRTSGCRTRACAYPARRRR